jgi:hypothetical protein
MNNYPGDTQYHSAAPFNENRTKTNWVAHYILACDGQTDSEYEVSFPAGLDWYFYKPRPSKTVNRMAAKGR